jgi:hypothetical protein
MKVELIHGIRIEELSIPNPRLVMYVFMTTDSKRTPYVVYYGGVGTATMSTEMKLDKNFIIFKTSSIKKFRKYVAEFNNERLKSGRMDGRVE